MKTRIILIVILIASLLSACTPKDRVSGKWTTNLGALTLVRNNDTVSGNLKGYGGTWDIQFEGFMSGDTLTITSQFPLGSTAIVFAGDGKIFKSADPKIGFCGARGTVLPDGCGFSGKWNLNLSLVPSGSYAQLQQEGDQVAGDVLGPDGAKLASLNSTVTWGKGWQANGSNAWGDFSLMMTSDEMAFQIYAPDSSGSKESPNWCALRDGQSTAYTFYFDCTIP
jgi:hypothetical protein